MIAARGGQPAAVDAVLAAHPNVNATDKSGNTALMHAVMSGSLAVVDKLLAAGASVAPRDAQEWSALDFAEVSGATGIAARLREKGATALHRNPVMAAYSQPTSVQRAQRDLYAGWPDLAVAAGRENPELLRTLLARGADPNALTPDGLPILTVAALSGTAHEVEALLADGAGPGAAPAGCGTCDRGSGQGRRHRALARGARQPARDGARAARARGQLGSRGCGRGKSLRSGLRRRRDGRGRSDARQRGEA